MAKKKKRTPQLPPETSQTPKAVNLPKQVKKVLRFPTLRTLLVPVLLTGFLAALVGFCTWFYWYTNIWYKDRIYPSVFIDNVPFGGKNPKDVEQYWMEKNTAFRDVMFEFSFEDQTATLTGSMIHLGYDATLSATQAYMVGRSPHFFANLNDRILRKRIDLPASFIWDEEPVKTTISSMSAEIDITPDDALFTFHGGKVTAFQPSKSGRAVNVKELMTLFEKSMPHVAEGKLKLVKIPIPVDTIPPKVTTENVNTFGIKERIGLGYSEFSGSIPGRIHNVALAAGRFNGVLIKPGEIFSFNKTVGDISAATGYQSAYIIKEGRTVLGDGGGVCQVSTTLFRAALDAGLPIVERHEHSYRVHYYEEGGYKPGLDATVFDPTDDLKFKNDTPAYILIQTKTDTYNLTLTFEMYGTSDGRKAEILNQKLWGVSPPPPDLNQDDPTLPKGTTKQVDFAAWGASASFQYKVTRNGETLIDRTFTSTYRPWQAIFLHGTKE
jgi:vancomycin resistance protein YoaR